MIYDCSIFLEILKAALDYYSKVGILIYPSLHGAMRLQDFFLWTFILMTFAINVNGEDLYELLGLNRQATTVEIRKAFKKLALTMHPDKNRVRQIYPLFLFSL